MILNKQSFIAIEKLKNLEILSKNLGYWAEEIESNWPCPDYKNIYYFGVDCCLNSLYVVIVTRSNILVNFNVLLSNACFTKTMISSINKLKSFLLGKYTTKDILNILLETTTPIKEYIDSKDVCLSSLDLEQMELKLNIHWDE